MNTEAIREKRIAEQEGHTAHDTDAYFKARPNYERPLNRKHFEEGHRRGYEAGMQQAVKDMDREEIGRLIYLSMYEEKGAVWPANEHKEVWYKKADYVIKGLRS